MKIKNGRIGNINTKLTAGILAFALVSSTIVGVTTYNNIKLEQKKYESFTGVVSFERLKKCYFIGVKNTEGNINYYIAEKNVLSNPNSYFYLDIISGKNIFVTKDLTHFTVDINQELVDEVKIEEYLYDFNMVERMYSEENINTILEQIKQTKNNKSK